jgi:malate dehydrogenase
VDVAKVTNLAIWGNHSATQYPDFFNAKIDGRAATEVISDHDWLKSDFIRTVQQRGAAIIKARGASSAASAANAVVDTVRSIETPTPAGDWYSVAICSQGDYGVEKGLIASFPIRTLPGGGVEVVKNVPIGDFSRSRIDATVQELKEERDLVRDLVG